MPVIVWELTDEGPRGTVETDWQVFTPEEVREEAEELDRSLDVILDGALKMASEVALAKAPPEFTRAWAIGASLRQASILEAPALVNEPRQRLWLAMARKCRTGIRADASLSAEWQSLRPSATREPRREGARLDHFEMCLWLSEQSFDDAAFTFGGSVRNVWQMLERPTLRPLVVRGALKAWLQSLPTATRENAVQPTMFPGLMKALRSRWPDRGPGSAKRPVHFDADTLAKEVSRILQPLTEEERSNA